MGEAILSIYASHAPSRNGAFIPRTGVGISPLAPRLAIKLTYHGFKSWSIDMFFATYARRVAYV